MADAKEVIATAVEFEKFGAEYYRRFRDLLEEKEAKALMASLASDEDEHAAVLTRELQALGGKAKAASGKRTEKGLAEIFPRKAKKGGLGVEDSISAIELGIGTEERSIEYYSRNAAAAGPGAKDIFARLEGMEREHLRLLQENLRQLRDQGSWLGYVPILEG
ncbi:MAG: Ferritin family protein [Candidatus Thermoplasmatota archaeon]|nr:Ferritin family protein [Candidatus Thermoplasmatota archaeon]